LRLHFNASFYHNVPFRPLKVLLLDDDQIKSNAIQSNTMKRDRVTSVPQVQSTL
jgi:hypothetical protein